MKKGKDVSREPIRLISRSVLVLVVFALLVGSVTAQPPGGGPAPPSQEMHVPEIKVEYIPPPDLPDPDANGRYRHSEPLTFLYKVTVPNGVSDFRDFHTLTPIPRSRPAGTLGYTAPQNAPNPFGGWQVDSTTVGRGALGFAHHWYTGDNAQAKALPQNDCAYFAITVPAGRSFLLPSGGHRWYATRDGEPKLPKLRTDLRPKKGQTTPPPPVPSGGGGTQAGPSGGTTPTVPRPGPVIESGPEVREGDKPLEVPIAAADVPEHGENDMDDDGVVTVTIGADWTGTVEALEDDAFFTIVLSTDPDFTGAMGEDSLPLTGNDLPGIFVNYSGGNRLGSDGTCSFAISLDDNPALVGQMFYAMLLIDWDRNEILEPDKDLTSIAYAFEVTSP